MQELYGTPIKKKVIDCRTRAGKLQAMNWLPAFRNTIYWNITTPIHLHVIYNSFGAILAELTTCTREHMNCKPKLFTGSLRKSLPILP